MGVDSDIDKLPKYTESSTTSLSCQHLLNLLKTFFETYPGKVLGQLPDRALDLLKIAILKFSIFNFFLTQNFMY